MDIKIFGRNIAAVSLIEIMMIFTIIGIVTVACANLSKPKSEYMKKIKIFAALSELESSAKILTREGHIDFTTDLGVCKNRNNQNWCLDYQDKYPGQNNQLPKVSMRDTTSVVDSGLNITAYSNLSDKGKEQFKYLQSGLCQRLSKTFNIASTSVNCSTSTTANGLIDESSSYPQTFTGYTPQLYLANGQVIYIGKNLYTDFRTTSENTVRNKIVVEPSDENYSTLVNGTEKMLSADLSNAMNYCAGYSSFFPYLKDSGTITMPNESRLNGIRSKNQYCNTDDYYKYLETMWAKNKDYFIVYVDIDCKKINNDDKQCGRDKLNEDVFAFRMYRDGTVMPDYQSGFPKDTLNAKVLVRDNIDMYGRYKNHSDYAYASLPLNFAKCYANLAGAIYSTTNYFDYTGMCSDSTRPARPLDECISIQGESTCKAVLNKPSFLMR